MRGYVHVMSTKFRNPYDVGCIFTQLRSLSLISIDPPCSDILPMCAVFQPPPELVGKVFPEREADSHVPACLQRRFARPPFQPDGVSFPFLRSLFMIDRLIKIFLLPSLVQTPVQLNTRKGGDLLHP